MTGVTGEGDGVTFQAYADMIGKSRPYVSKLVAQGVIRPASMTADRKIIPHLADADRAASADPARAKPGGAGQGLLPASEDATFNAQRTRKMAADAERAEIELRARKGELIERSQIQQVWAPLLRQLRDDLTAVPRDVITDPVEVADCETALAAALEAFCARLEAGASESNHGGDAAA
ncbi:hypothetical protein [Roseococcus microcysteis]|uniref:hypothetical protein n=1 Tax=Roseococcus microcysteis TaxID=2771361 RepID=UPI00168AC093|nr:hypothetical protein [Roseococcus microcysteis]